MSSNIILCYLVQLKHQLCFIEIGMQLCNAIQKSKLTCLSCTPPLQWRHNGHDNVSNHQPHDCLLNRLFRRRSKITSNLRVTGLCAGISPGTGEFPAQMTSNADNVSIWWRHHDMLKYRTTYMQTLVQSIAVVTPSIFYHHIIFDTAVTAAELKIRLQTALTLTGELWVSIVRICDEMSAL